VLLVRGIQINTIETADHESRDELEEAEDAVCDVGKGHFETVAESHLGVCSVSFRYLLKLVFVLR
jgi:hypothetical protein